jgi:hypothetical protein
MNRCMKLALFVSALATLMAFRDSCTANWGLAKLVNKNQFVYDQKSFPEGTHWLGCTFTLPDGSSQINPGCVPHLNVVVGAFTCCAGTWVSDAGGAACHLRER